MVCKQRAAGRPVHGVHLAEDREAALKDTKSTEQILSVDVVKPRQNRIVVQIKTIQGNNKATNQRYEPIFVGEPHPRYVYPR